MVRKTGSKKSGAKGKQAGTGTSTDAKGWLLTLTDPKFARRAALAGQRLGPVVLPQLARAATATRGYLDEQKALRLGIAPADVGAYRGAVGASLARIDALGRSLGDLRTRRGGDLATARMIDRSEDRLADLRNAASTSRAMPASHRRATLRTVGHELDRLESDVVTALLTPPVH